MILRQLPAQTLCKFYNMQNFIYKIQRTRKDNRLMRCSNGKSVGL